VTPREEKFARLLVEGLSQSAAFRTVTPNAKNWKPDSIHQNASKLAAKVLPRVREMQEEAKDRALLSLEEHMTKLQELRDRAVDDSTWSSAITAEVKRGELMGFYVARSENTNTNYNISDSPVSEDDWADQYAESSDAVH
jgi:hypothetical protein